MPKDKKYLIVIAGPTAVGKTDICLKLAEWLFCPVIVADSRQVFREMHIGTAKIDRQETRGVEHYLIDIASVGEGYSVGRFERDFLEITGDLYENHNCLILSGGTGLFIKAAIEGLDEFPPVPNSIRKKWDLILAENGLPFLQEALLQQDPEYASQVDLENHSRLIRALSVIEASGRPFSSFLTGKSKKRDFIPVKILLDRSRAELYERINIRVDDMIVRGLLEEVTSLLPYKEHQALNTVGYKEMIAHLEGNISLDEAVNKIKQHSRNYAKRQLTWFRNQDAWEVFHPDELEKMKTYLSNQITNG